MAATSTADLMQLGRQVAMQQGITLDAQTAAAYGREVEFRLGRRQNIPTVDESLGRRPVSRPSHSPGGVRPAAAPPSPRRSVKFLGFEISRAGEPTKSRVQRRARRGEATTGRYRSAHYHSHPAHPYRHPVTTRHRR